HSVRNRRSRVTVSPWTERERGGMATAVAAGNVPLLEMRGIRKRFGDLEALKGVDLTVRQGEIHALVGENGAGKSTLMNVLYGLYRPDAGTIAYRGRPVHLAGPRDAIALGIGMIHQHFMLVPPLTVAENVVLGDERGGPMLADRVIEDRVRALEKRFGIEVDPAARVEDIPLGLQQRVEIIKVLYRGSELLIFDEPTAVLTPQEVDELFDIVRGLRDEGKTLILITHKLREVMAVTDRVTVLRGGQNVAELVTKSTNPSEIARAMVGRELKELRARATPPRDEVVLAFTVADNFILGKHDHAPYARRGVLDPATILGTGGRLAAEYDVRPPNARAIVANLSGGNQQKVVLGRELSEQPKLIVVSQPTRGLDIAATEYVHERLLEQRGRGAAILLISSELDEVRGLSDRIAVMFEGRIVA